MSIGRQHKARVMAQLAAATAVAKQADAAKTAASTVEKSIPVEVLSQLIGVANKQRKLAELGRIRLVESAADLPTVAKGFDALVAPGKKSDFNLVLQALNDDLDLLHKIPAINEKQALKVQLLGKYMPMVNAYITSGTQFANPVLVHCIIWSIDVEQFQQAIDLADVAIAQNQKTPDYIKRELPDFVVEEFAEWACKQAKAKQSVSPFIEQVIARVEDAEWPVDEPIIKGKLYRYAGLVLDNFEEFAAALALYEKAQAANEQAGCKGRIKAIKEKLNIQ